MRLVYASRTTTIAALATVLLLLPGLLGMASANHGGLVDAEMCGTTITSNTTLNHDVGPCPGDGLVIGASDITLDLNGHDVYGLEGVPQVTGDGVGIFIDGHNKVIVKDGHLTEDSEVRGFDAGVVMRGGGGHTVEDLDILRNQGPASTFGAGEGEGIALWSSDDNTLQGNDVLDNGPWSGIGIYESNNNMVDDNKVNNNTYEAEPVFANQNIGIRVGQNSSNNTLTDNEANNNGLDGITVFFGSTGNTIHDNNTHDNPRNGIRLFPNADANTVDANRASGNGADWPPGLHSAGIWIGSDDNVVSDNKVNSNHTDGLVVYDSINNTITGSTALGNGGTDLVDTHGNCLNNTWSSNTYGTKDPACIN